MNKQDWKKIGDLAARYETLCWIQGVKPDDRLTTEMDLELAVEAGSLSLDKLGRAGNHTFIHDIGGIKTHIDRAKRVFDTTFLPRCSC